MLGPALRAFLIEGVDGLAVFPVRLPQDPPMPAATYRLIGDFSGSVHTGPSGLKEQRIQIDIYHDNYDACVAVSADVERLLDGYRGPWSDGITVGHCHLDNDFDGDDSQTRVWRRVHDYILAYNEAAGS